MVRDTWETSLRRQSQERWWPPMRALPFPLILLIWAGSAELSEMLWLTPSSVRGKSGSQSFVLKLCLDSQGQSPLWQCHSGADLLWSTCWCLSREHSWVSLVLLAIITYPSSKTPAISSWVGEQTAPTSATVTSHQQSSSLETSDWVTLSLRALARDSWISDTGCCFEIAKAAWERARACHQCSGKDLQESTKEKVMQVASASYSLSDLINSFFHMTIP